MSLVSTESMIKLYIKFTEDDNLVLERKIDIEEDKYESGDRLLLDYNLPKWHELVGELEDIMNDKKGEEIL